MHHVASLLNTGKGKYHNLHDIQRLLARIYFNNTSP